MRMFPRSILGYGWQPAFLIRGTDIPKKKYPDATTITTAVEKCDMSRNTGATVWNGMLLPATAGEG